MGTNYYETFITVSPDSMAEAGIVPTKMGGVAQLQYALVAEHPYTLTSDDVLFEVHALRKGIAPADREAERAAFFAKPQACLRASPLVKQFGWGIHHDGEGRIALHGIDTSTYRALGGDPKIKKVAGMRSKRG